MQLRLTDITIVYDDTGLKDISFPTVLFLHGYPLSRQIWQQQVNGFSDSVRIISPDLRGFGDTQGSQGAYSMEMLADDCITLLDRLGIFTPIVICGLSMGGYIAFALYRKYPHRVQALILCATRTGADSSEAKANRDKAISLVEKEGIQAIVKLMLPKMFAPVTYQNHPELVDTVRTIIQSASVPGVKGVLQGMRDRPDSSPLLARITVPTLLLFGDQDQFINRVEAEEMNEAIPGAKLHIIHNTGHLLNMEQPDSFNNHIRTFLLSLYG